MNLTILLSTNNGSALCFSLAHELPLNPEREQVIYIHIPTSTPTQVSTNLSQRFPYPTTLLSLADNQVSVHREMHDNPKLSQNNTIRAYRFINLKILFNERVTE